MDGLYDKNPHVHDDAQLLSWVNEINEDVYAMAGSSTSAVGTGGMRTKVQAAEKAVSHGINTFIVNGFTELTFNMLLEGKNPGTHFQPYEVPLKEHVHWMTHTSKAQGELIVEDEFDGHQLDIDTAQLTSAEVLAVRGDFAVGDTILVRKSNGDKVAKAKSNYSSCLLSFIAEQDDQAFAADLQNDRGPIISNNSIAILEE